MPGSSIIGDFGSACQAAARVCGFHKERHMQLPANAALIVIDVQQGFLDPRWGQRNNPAAEDNIAALLAAWRAARRPLIHVRHASTSPGGTFRAGTPGFAFKPQAQPLMGEPVVTKSV